MKLSPLVICIWVTLITAVMAAVPAPSSDTKGAASVLPGVPSSESSTATTPATTPTSSAEPTSSTPSTPPPPPPPPPPSSTPSSSAPPSSTSAPSSSSSSSAHSQSSPVASITSLPSMSPSMSNNTLSPSASMNSASSMSASATPTSSSSSSSVASTPVIIGSVCGFVAILAIGFGYALLSKVRKNSRKDRVFGQNDDEMPAPPPFDSDLDYKRSPSPMPSRLSPPAATRQLHEQDYYNNNQYGGYEHTGGYEQHAGYEQHVGYDQAYDAYGGAAYQQPGYGYQQPDPHGSPYQQHAAYGGYPQPTYH